MSLLGALGRVAAREVGLAHALRRLGQELDDQPAGPPAVAEAAIVAKGDLGDRQANAGRDLLGLAEIGVGDLLEAVAFERHDALVAAGIGALVDGHGERAVAEQRARTGLPRPAAATRSASKRA